MKEQKNSKANSTLTGEADSYFTHLLDFIIDSAGIGLWDWFLDERKVVYSKEWETILGYDAGELPQVIESWESAVLPEDLSMVNKIIDDALSSGSDRYEAEFRMVKKDGSIIWAQDRGSVTAWDKNGKPTKMTGVLQDVTRLKATEQKLKEKTEQLNFINQLVGLASWDWDIKNDKILFHKDYLSMLGYPDGKTIGSFEEWASLCHPEDREKTMTALDDYLTGKSSEYSHEIRMKHKNGNYVWTLDVGRISEWDSEGNPTRVIGGHLNINERKKIEQQLKNALYENEQYNVRLQSEVENALKNSENSQMTTRAMLDATPYICILFNSKLEVIDCNPETLKYFGFSSKEAVKKSLLKLL